MSFEPIYELSRATWEFGRGDGTIIARRIQLKLGGTVQFSKYDNERYWSIRNGNLCFLNSRKEVTTEFTERRTAPTGETILEGRFLGRGFDVMHVLREIPRMGASAIPDPAPRVAVLLRTHLMNAKVDDLLSILSESGCFDLYVCADCTRSPLEFLGVPTLRHSVRDAEAMGFAANHDELMWYCGDYALYFSYTQIPDYDYYFMIEYDIDLPDRSALLIEGIINRLDFGRPTAFDFIGCRSWQGGFDNGWGRTVAGRYPEAHLCLFPFVVVSRAAIEYLIAERRKEKASQQADGRLMFCEAFVPSALNAGGFRRADLNHIMPGTVADATFRVAADAGPMLLGNVPNVSPRVKLLHPVFDECSFVEYHVARAIRSGDRGPLTALAHDPALALSAESRQRIAQILESQ